MRFESKRAADTCGKSGLPHFQLVAGFGRHEVASTVDGA
jgi:hypothetical protein